MKIAWSVNEKKWSLNKYGWGRGRMVCQRNILGQQKQDEIVSEILYSGQARKSSKTVIRKHVQTNTRIHALLLIHVCENFPLFLHNYQTSPFLNWKIVILVLSVGKQLTCRIENTMIAPIRGDNNSDKVPRRLRLRCNEDFHNSSHTCSRNPSFRTWFRTVIVLCGSDVCEKSLLPPLILTILRKINDTKCLKLLLIPANFLWNSIDMNWNSTVYVYVLSRLTSFLTVWRVLARGQNDVKSNLQGIWL